MLPCLYGEKNDNLQEGNRNGNILQTRELDRHALVTTVSSDRCLSQRKLILEKWII